MHKINLTNYKEKNIFKLSDKFKGTNPKGEEILFTNFYMEKDGKPFFAIAGECPISRVKEYQWEDTIIKMKMAGINIVASYIVWIHHEENEGEFDFTGDKNLRKFVELCKKHNMYVNLRIGPFVHGEIRNGGIPDWLYGKPFETRSLDEGFLFYTRRWYKKLYEQFSGLFFKDGGPIITIQLDNEYGHSCSPWVRDIGTTDEWLPIGHDKEEYMLKLKEIAIEEGLVVPFYTNTGWGGAPTPTNEMLPTNGAYAYWPWIYYNYTGPHPALKEFIYRDYHNNEIKQMHGFNPEYLPESVPYSCCEMGLGMVVSYKYRFKVDAQSGPAIANNKIAGGCNFLGYYIFKGGTNPDSKNHINLNENQNPKKSYDFQTAIGEYGQIRESYNRIKLIHFFAKAYENILCKMKTELPKDIMDIEPEDVTSLRYCIRTNGNSGFLFINNYQDHVKNVDINNENVLICLKEKNIAFENISLNHDEQAILPFNLNMNGYIMTYGKIQPLSILENKDITTYVFFSPKGMKPEFLLEGEKVSSINNAFVNEKNILICPNPNNNVNTYIIDGENGRIQIIILSNDYSLKYFEIKKQNDTIMFISDAPVLYNNENVKIETPDCDCESINVLCYPNQNLIGDKTITEDILQGVNIPWKKKELKLEYKKVGKNRYTIDIPQGIEGCKEALLKIDYVGDVGNLFINGHFIADDFNNGTVWETGLKDYCDTLKNEKITLLISPIKKGTKVNTDSVMAGFFMETEEEIAKINKITLEFKYEKTIN